MGTFTGYSGCAEKALGADVGVSSKGLLTQNTTIAKDTEATCLSYGNNEILAYERLDPNSTPIASPLSTLAARWSCLSVPAGSQSDRCTCSVVSSKNQSGGPPNLHD